MTIMISHQTIEQIIHREAVKQGQNPDLAKKIYYDVIIPIPISKARQALYVLGRNGMIILALTKVRDYIYFNESEYTRCIHHKITVTEAGTTAEHIHKEHKYYPCKICPNPFDLNCENYKVLRGEDEKIRF
jgi:hypothetical protein